MAVYCIGVRLGTFTFAVRAVGIISRFMSLLLVTDSASVAVIVNGERANNAVGFPDILPVTVSNVNCDVGNAVVEGDVGAMLKVTVPSPPLAVTGVTVAV